MGEKKKKYEVKIERAEGSCNTNLFKKMAKFGDLQSVKIQNLIDSTVTIKGYATCEITTDDGNFILNYIDTDEYGLISTGSMIFIESVINYIEDVNKFMIKEVKTGKGKTYKAVPILNETENEE